ncbi:MAG: Wzz/FepE/Etk N-terminal domain-containing protein [Halomonadaceae bacterium]|jgi:hypothetical protein
MTTPSSPRGSQPNVPNDEISLVELAKILIKRWKAFAITFLLVAAGALGYAITQEQNFQYVSIYQVAEQAPRSAGGLGALETPSAVIAKVENLYLGPLIRDMREEGGSVGVSLDNPSDTLLVRLTTETLEANNERATILHERLLEKIVEDQQTLLERNRERLEHQLASAQQALETAERGGSSGDMLAAQLTRVTELETQLAQLNEGQVVQVAVQSLSPTGNSRRLILLVGLLAAGVLAILAAFLSHFVSLVRSSLREEQGD